MMPLCVFVPRLMIKVCVCVCVCVCVSPQLKASEASTRQALSDGLAETDRKVQLITDNLAARIDQARAELESASATGAASMRESLDAAIARLQQDQQAQESRMGSLEDASVLVAGRADRLQEEVNKLAEQMASVDGSVAVKVGELKEQVRRRTHTHTHTHMHIHRQVGHTHTHMHTHTHAGANSRRAAETSSLIANDAGPVQRAHTVQRATCVCLMCIASCSRHVRESDHQCNSLPDNFMIACVT